MKTLTIERLARLADAGNGPVVTLVEPVRMPNERARAELEWRQLLHDARVALDEAAVPSDVVDRMMSTAERPLTDGWPSHERGLAYIASTDIHELFALTRDVDPFWAVGDRPAFHALIMCVDDPPAQVLTLDLHDTQLYELAGNDLRPVPVELLARTIEEVVPAVEHGQHLTRHGGAHVGRGIVGIVHGEDDAGIERQHELDVFCRAVDDALSRRVSSDECGPLVVAGVTDLVARLRKVARRPERFATAIEGSPAHVGHHELARRARAALNEHLDRAVAASVERFRARHGLGVASDDLIDIAAAANEGRVDELLLPAALGHPSDVTALLDEAIADVLHDGGRVTVVPIGHLDTVAAIYRW